MSTPVEYERLSCEMRALEATVERVHALCYEWMIHGTGTPLLDLRRALGVVVPDGAATN